MQVQEQKPEQNIASEYEAKCQLLFENNVKRIIEELHWISKPHYVGSLRLNVYKGVVKNKNIEQVTL